VPDNQQPLALANSVTPDYLKVMGIKLLAGSFFTAQDRLGSEAVAVVDDVMAEQAWHGRDPIGQHLWIGLGTDPLRVIGVVGHVRYWGPAGDDAARTRAQIYYPFAQVPDRWIRRWSELMSVAVRTTTPPLGLVGSLRHELRGTASDQVLYEVRTMEDLARSSLDRQRFLMVLFGIFAGLALLLACIGIYGVLGYLTSRRVPEFGVRIALGATAGDVTGLVLRQSLGLIGLGVAAGLAAALAAARLLQRLVEGMQPTGPATFALMIAILTAAAVAASFVPAHRAGRLDAMKALRQE
jgi:putative ABC transport system permease protein